MSGDAQVRAIDVHAHADAPAVMGLVAPRPEFEQVRADWLATFGAASVELNAQQFVDTYPPMLTAPERLRLMDAGKVDVQAVSVVPTLYHYWADAALGADIAAASNESIAATVAQAPDRLVGLANVSLQHPEAAAEQLRSAMREQGLRGVQIGTNAGPRELGDRALDPFWAAAEELDAFVFLHPWGCTLGSRLSEAYLGNVVGNPTETNLALNSIVFGGVLDRFPRVAICGAHGGGYFPHYLARANHAYRVRPESRTMEREPSTYRSQLFVDSLVYDEDELRRLVAVMGAGRVLLGTDYPFDMGEFAPVDKVDALGLDAVERDAIVGGTAARLGLLPG